MNKIITLTLQVESIISLIGSRQVVAHLATLTESRQIETQLATFCNPVASPTGTVTQDPTLRNIESNCGVKTAFKRLSLIVQFDSTFRREVTLPTFLYMVLRAGSIFRLSTPGPSKK